LPGVGRSRRRRHAARAGARDFFIVEAEDEHVRATMPVMSGILNPFGTVHGAAIVWFE
jgi:acyl-coenzyme A thioesterase PaaI-like protein